MWLFWRRYFSRTFVKRVTDKGFNDFYKQTGLYLYDVVFGKNSSWPGEMLIITAAPLLTRQNLDEIDFASKEKITPTNPPRTYLTKISELYAPSKKVPIYFLHYLGSMPTVTLTNWLFQ